VNDEILNLLGGAESGAKDADAAAAEEQNTQNKVRMDLI